MARTRKPKSKNKEQLKARINPALKKVLEKTPMGEDPKKGGVKYYPPGLFKMDGTPIKGRASRKKTKRNA